MKNLRSAVCLAAIFAAALAVAQDAQPAKGKAAANSPQAELRASRMVKNALQLFESKEDERAVNMLEAVPRLYPESEARFSAHLELGRHFADKRTFDRATQELRKAMGSTNTEVRAQSLFMQGDVHAQRGEKGEAMMIYRRLTQEYPTSPFANDAFFEIGQIHFDDKRWARASEAFNMVGTAVPREDGTNRVVLAEAGQRVFAHVADKDLTVLKNLGGKSYVDFIAKNGDRERVELEAFGGVDGDFIASVETTIDPSKPNDGKLTVHGGEEVRCVYVDANAESGAVNVTLKADSRIVSSGSIAFMDGAQRQRVRGVFVDQPAFVRLRDLDLDTTPNPDAATVRVKILYRERPEPVPGSDEIPQIPADAPWLTRGEQQLQLVETGPRTGIFAGRIVPKLLPENTNDVVELGRDGVGVRPEEKLVVEYDDVSHLEGSAPALRSADVAILVGGSTEPQSIVAHASEATIQARKLLLEAQLLHKWGAIFKEVGLDETAKSKSDEGLERVSQMMAIASRNSLDRSVIEDAYEAKWNLLLCQGRLQDAIGVCRQLVQRYPDTLLADRAFMQIGMARRGEKTVEAYNSAIQVFNGILSLPNSQLKAEAQFRIGECIEERIRLENEKKTGGKIDFSPAMVAFKRCAEAYPSSSYAGDSFKRVIDYYVSTRDYPRATETLERVAQDYPDAPWMDDMLLKWGIVCYRMGNKEGAAEKFKRILEEYPSGAAAKQAATFVAKLDAQ